MTIRFEDITWDDYDTKLTRHNKRTDKPYTLYVKVIYHYAGTPPSWDSPGDAPEIEAVAWGSMGQEIKLTDDELNQLIEDGAGVPEPDYEAIAEARAEARYH
jgi:hypothetical protein